MSDQLPPWHVTVFHLGPQVYRIELAGRSPVEFATSAEVLRHLEALFRQVEAAEAPERVDTPRESVDLRPFDLEEARQAGLVRSTTDELLAWADVRYAGQGENWLAGFRAGLCRLALHDRGEGFMEGYRAGRSLLHALGRRE